MGVGSSAWLDAGQAPEPHRDGSLPWVWLLEGLHMPLRRYGAPGLPEQSAFGLVTLRTDDHQENRPAGLRLPRHGCQERAPDDRPRLRGIGIKLSRKSFIFNKGFPPTQRLVCRSLPDEEAVFQGFLSRTSSL